MTPIEPVPIIPKLPWRKIFIALLAWLFLYVLFDTPNRFFYWEREWQIPTDPREKAAYDFAHSIQLPKQAPIGGFKYLKVNKNFKVPVSEKNMPLIETTIPQVPDPVPFSFAWARFKSLFGLDEPVRVQYFNHLCETEAAEYIYKRVDKVEGIYQMRPMAGEYDKSLNDRYAMEDPIDWNGVESAYAARNFVSPIHRKFHFFESIRSPNEIASEVAREKWQIAPTPAINKAYFWRYEPIKIPPPANWIDQSLIDSIKAVPIEQLTARYAYTWRGIKRPHDRRYGIAGGELIVLNRLTNEVLGFRRGFAMTHTKGIYWDYAAVCPRRTGAKGTPLPASIKDSYSYHFINQIFKPLYDDYQQYHFKFIER